MTVVLTHKPVPAKAQAVLRTLIERGSLTALEALHAGLGMRLAARIDELRECYGDAAIPDVWESADGKRWKRYFWKPEPQGDLFGVEKILRREVASTRQAPHAGTSDPYETEVGNDAR